MIDAAALLAGMLDAIEQRPELAARLRSVLAGAVDLDAPIAIADCGESVRTLRRAIRAGELAGSKRGRSYYTTRRALTAWRAASHETPKVTQKVESPSRNERTAADRALARARAAGVLRVVGGGR